MQVANAMIGGYFGRQADQMQRQADTSLASSISGQPQPTQPATPSLVDRASSTLGNAANSVGSTLGSAFDDASGFVKRLFQVESGGDPNAVTGSNRGLGQFSPDMEAKYGINDQNRTDPNAQARAVMQMPISTRRRFDRCSAAIHRQENFTFPISRASPEVPRSSQIPMRQHGARSALLRKRRHGKERHHRKHW